MPAPLLMAAAGLVATLARHALPPAAAPSSATPALSGAITWWTYPGSDCGYDDLAANCSGAALPACKAKCASRGRC